MARHLNDQYYGGNRLKEVGAPVDGPDAANKTYVDEALAARGVHIYRNLTGQAAVTSSPYYCARWDVTDESVTEYRDGMVVCVKVPVAGNGSYGTALQINSLGYKPIVYNVNTMIGTRYSAGSVVWAVYNTTQMATLYLGSGPQTIIGCWQVMDYCAAAEIASVIADIVQDNDGNWYDGVIIGNKIWLKQNLRTTHYADGKEIPAGGNNASESEPYYYESPSDMPLIQRGYLYNWIAARNACPTGWHLPTDAEWRNMEETLTSETITSTGWRGDHAGKLSGEGWNSSPVAGAPGDASDQYHNISGFSAIPAGRFATTGSDLTDAFFWSYTQYQSNGGWFRRMTYNNIGVNRSAAEKTQGMSVRCVCDLSATEWFAVNGDRLYLKHTPLGAAWSLLPKVAKSGNYNDLTNKPTIPTVPTNVSDFNNDAGYLTAHQAMRTVNHEQLTDSSLGDANLHDGFYFPNAVQDYDGNWYGAVVIGDQVWLAENLRTTHYADGTAITQADVSSITEDPRYFAPQGMDPAVYGLYYNWNAVMNGEDGSNANPSGVQGIAPIGWHIPSKTECEQLKGYIEKQSRYHGAKALAATSGWESSDVEGAPGNNQAQNNAAGLNIIAAGRVYNILDYQQMLGYFWTSTDFIPVQINIPYYCAVSYQDANLVIDNIYNRQGMSVRLLSDMTPVQFRNWYIRQYGSLQHHLPQVVIVSGILHYTMFVISLNTTNNCEIQENPSPLAEIDAACVAGNTVMLSITFGTSTSAVLFMPKVQYEDAYSFKGSMEYNGRIYFINVSPERDANNQYVYVNTGGAPTLQWNVIVKSIAIQ